MAVIYYEKDCNPKLLEGKTIGIVGYGSQGHAHAQNLRDSGFKVIIGGVPGSPSCCRAADEKFEVLSTADMAKKADLIMILAPDQTQAKIYREDIAPHLRKGMMLMFAHGFNIHFGQILPPDNIDVAMIAPKGPGHMVRQVYTEGAGVPALIAVYQDATGNAKATALAYAAGIGAARAAVLETTFAEETETDLFGEQAVLCGGASALIKAGFETLVKAGYQPEVAYFECCHELKLIVDLIYQGGLKYMRYSISDTAEYGDYSRGPRIVTEETKKEMGKILGEIQDGSFAREWILENQAGKPHFNAQRRIEAAHPIEKVGEGLRGMMSWLKKPKK